MMIKMKYVFLSLLCLSLCACVNQNKQSVSDNQGGENRIIATSVATAEIMDKLEVDLIAVPDTNVSTLPKRYEDAERIGLAMSVDMEKVAALNPTYVFSPVSLISDMLPKYEAANVNYGFLNLNNVDGMFKSIQDLGELLDRKKQADALVADYENYMQAYREKTKGKRHPKVLVLMGFPGSYVVATPKSYIGSLVELAGGENVYDAQEQFINVSSEDMLKKNPDIILRTSHALPEEVTKMFKDEFVKNDTWKHFDAVKNGKVYDLDHQKFGMSANFKYKEALENLGEILYE